MLDTIFTVINEVYYYITPDQEKIKYKDELYDIIDDQEGDYYFLYNNKAIYFKPM